MMWFEEGVRITPELAQSLRLLLVLRVVGLYISMGLVLLGLIMLAVTLPKNLGRVLWNLQHHCKE